MSFFSLEALRGIADDYCKGEEIQRTLMEEVCEKFLVLADERLSAPAEEQEFTVVMTMLGIVCNAEPDYFVGHEADLMLAIYPSVIGEKALEWYRKHYAPRSPLVPK